jgi:hypothetical protein
MIEIRRSGKFIEVIAQGLVFRAINLTDILDLIKDILTSEGYDETAK